MANMTFKASLLPNTSLGYSLGSEDKQWNIYGELNGNASSATKATQDKNGLQIDTGYLKLSGGTMSGNIIEKFNITLGTNPTSDIYAPRISCVDSTGANFGFFRGAAMANGRTGVQIVSARNINDSSIVNGLSLFVNNEGTPTVGIDQPAAWRTALNTVTKTGEGASGTWDISITGNAATATKCGDGSCYGYFHHSNELNFGGSNNSTTIYFGYRAMDSRAIPTNFIFGSSTGTATIQCSSIYLGSGTTYSVSSSGLVCAGSSRINPSQGALYLGNSGNQSWVYVQDICSQTSKDNWKITQDGIGTFKTCKGAVWNDYAEMRNVPEAQNNIEFNINKKGIEESRTYPQAGRCVKEKGNGEMQLSTKRLEYGCKIISDTFGFCIGETDNCKTPIAVTGRVLAYPYEDIEILKQHIGEPVCSGPNGTISLMTHEEEKEWPSKILGIISEIPNYNIWHCGVEGKESIKVNGRIWIYVR